MARIDTLSNFLTDVADAIRTKTGSSDPIDAEDFDAEIGNLPSGADLNDYFYTTLPDVNGSAKSLRAIKKFPSPLYISNNSLNISSLFSDFSLLEYPKIICGSQVTNMFELYKNVNESITATTIDVSGLDTTNVTNMSGMFYSCTTLQSLDLSGFNTSNVTNMSNMFRNCPALATLNISSFNTAKVTSMSSMFNGCPFQTINVSNFNTESVTNLNYLFANCYSLQTIDLSSFNTPLLTDTRYMFNNCTNLAHIDMRNFDFTLVTTYYTNMFGATASTGVPDNCEIIVKDDTAKTWITSKFSRLTNVKTVAELENE